MLTATGCGLSVPPLGAHHGPPLGGTSNTTSSGRGCLFESGQIERFDQDLKRVYDVGSSEIARQGRPKEKLKN